MNEDLKPCLDIESEWEISPEYGARPGVQIFQHKMHKDLLRIIDYKNQAFFFTDKHRVKLNGIIDINKKIEPIRKANLAIFLNRIMDAEKPITMPYTPEKIKVYIEDLGDILGVLYYMDSDPDKTLVPIKRYFKMEHFQKPEEIIFTEYQTLKEKMESEAEDGNDTTLEDPKTTFHGTDLMWYKLDPSIKATYKNVHLMSPKEYEEWRVTHKETKDGKDR